jgi:predicted ester cyclase
MLHRKPPDTSRVSPVMYLESDDARYTAVGAISSGCPMRPSGACVSTIFWKVTADEARGMYPFHLEIKEVLVAGNRVVVRGEVSGTPAGDLFGVAHTGKSFRIMAIDRSAEGRGLPRWPWVHRNA